MGGVCRCVIPCFKATINLEFSIPLVPHVGYGIGRETRRGLESGVSGNAALKIDKRLRVVDQSGAFRCIRAGRDPACPGHVALLTSTEIPAISLKLHTMSLSTHGHLEKITDTNWSSRVESSLRRLGHLFCSVFSHYNVHVIYIDCCYVL